MTTNDRFERRLPAMLEDYAVPRMPAYFDDVISTTARTRQRPGWSFPERWFPMSAISERLATAPRLPWRMVAIAALLVLAAVAAAALIAGSRQPRVPAPFGVAANGLVAFVDDSGAITAIDAATGDSRVLVAGPGNQQPMFSPDGTRLAYLRPRGADPGIVVARADGSAPVVVGDKSLDLLTWMPDSRSVVASRGGDLVAVDATRLAEPRPLLESVAPGDEYNLREATLFRPPDGREVLAIETGADGLGLYAHAVPGSTIRPILTQRTSPIPFDEVARPQWSPDGTRIALMLLPAGGTQFDHRIYVVNADGSGLRQLSPESVVGGHIDEGHPSWSPDGSRVAFQRAITTFDSTNDPRPITVVDVATGDATEVGHHLRNGFAGWAWSPDGTAILQVDGESEVIVWDIVTSKRTPLGSSPGAATWQRVLP